MKSIAIVASALLIAFFQLSLVAQDEDNVELAVTGANENKEKIICFRDDLKGTAVLVKGPISHCNEVPGTTELKIFVQFKNLTDKTKSVITQEVKLGEWTKQMGNDVGCGKIEVTAFAELVSIGGGAGSGTVCATSDKTFTIYNIETTPVDTPEFVRKGHIIGSAGPIKDIGSVKIKGQVCIGPGAVELDGTWDASSNLMHNLSFSAKVLVVRQRCFCG